MARVSAVQSVAGCYAQGVHQGLLQYDVNELIAVYVQMVRADVINGTDFAREQAEYITGHYPQVVLTV